VIEDGRPEIGRGDVVVDHFIENFNGHRDLLQAAIVGHFDIAVLARIPLGYPHQLPATAR
jgi:hypothetical protein